MGTPRGEGGANPNQRQVKFVPFGIFRPLFGAGTRIGSVMD